MGAARARARPRAVRRAAAESLPHAVEETCRPLFRLRRGACLRLQFLDTRIGEPQRLVLYQHGLRQRVDRVRRAGQTLGNEALGLRVARLRFELAQSVEQTFDEFLFLRGHRPPSGWSFRPSYGRRRWGTEWRFR